MRASSLGDVSPQLPSETGDDGQVDTLLECQTSSWLCPTELDRARIVGNAVRVRRASITVTLTIGLAVLYFAPTSGWWSAALFALAMPFVATTAWRVRRSAHPEYQVAATLLWLQLTTTASVALSGGPRSPLMAATVIPTVFAAVRFRQRVVVTFGLLAAASLLAATFGVNFSVALANPGGVIVALAMLISATSVVVAISDAELEQRSESILDPLTGLLNRTGLSRRFEEIAGQARATNAAVSLLVCDIDHFKMVNDIHGHDRGDIVLRELAAELRHQLRSFELIYRMGGEEFLVILPGASGRHAELLAQRLREATEQLMPGGVDITISVGVSSARGEGARFTQLFKSADDALYEAKAAGRNRVVVARDPALAAPRRFTTVVAQAPTEAAAAGH